MYLYGGIIKRRIRNDRSNVKGVSQQAGKFIESG